jgi:hemolysin III
MILVVQPAISPKPKLRGWIHEVSFPAVLAAGAALVLQASTLPGRIAAGVYTLTSAVLFGVSALYHRGSWKPRAKAVLRRLDHANIFLLIAGTYTPVAVLALHGTTRVSVLVAVWSAAALGVGFRMAWIDAPRRLYTALYVIVGWVMVFVMPELLRGAGAVAFSLIISGGVLYSLGGLVYGLKRPNPWPKVFGFHEVFHSLTVLAYAAQYSAILIMVLSGLRVSPT